MLVERAQLASVSTARPGALMRRGARQPVAGRTSLEVAGLPVRQDRTVPRGCLEVVTVFQEAWESINDMSKVHWSVGSQTSGSSGDIRERIKST